MCAAKSFLIGPPGSIRQTRVVPCLRSEKVTLPNSDWGSDHACVSGLLSLRNRASTGRHDQQQPQAKTLRSSAPDDIIELRRLIGANANDTVLKAIDTRGDLHFSQLPSGGPSRITTTVPVFQTILVKRLIEEGGNDDPRPHLVGTVIQRPLLMPLHQVCRQSDDNQKFPPYFEMRINDVFLDSEKCQRRRVTTKPVEVMHDHRTVVGESTACTFNVKLPLSTREIYAAHPFHILTLECVIQLSTVDGTLNGQALRLLPDLLYHGKDLRNLVSVRNWDGVKPKLDFMHSYDLVNPNPTVEFLVEFDPKLPPENQREAAMENDEDRKAYVPAIRLTWYVRRGAMQGFLESFAPLLFAAVALTIHLRYVNGNKGGEDFVDYLGNILAIALTVVFVLPSLSSKDRIYDGFESNHVVILLFFAGLILSMFANYDAEKPIRWKNFFVKPFVWSLCFIWTALLLPIRSFFNYHYRCFRIDTSIGLGTNDDPEVQGTLPKAIVGFFWWMLRFCGGTRVIRSKCPMPEPTGRCFLGYPSDAAASDIPYDELCRFVKKRSPACGNDDDGPSHIEYSNSADDRIRIHAVHDDGPVAEADMKDFLRLQLLENRSPTQHNFRWTPSKPHSIVYGIPEEDVGKWANAHHSKAKDTPKGLHGDVPSGNGPQTGV